MISAGLRMLRSADFLIYFLTYFKTKLLSVNDRTLDIWDYSKSILDPISSTTLNSGSKSINFAPHSDSIFLGDADGRVLVKKVVSFKNCENNFCF